MGLKLTVQEARSAGFKKVKAGDHSKGITIDSPKREHLCYISPCDGEGRVVCYYLEEGCVECYWEPDPSCS